MFEQYTPVIAVTPTGGITKQPDFRGRLRFMVPAQFTLNTGAVAAYEVTSEKKKDIPLRLASLQELIRRGALAAEVHDGRVTATLSSLDNIP